MIVDDQGEKLCASADSVWVDKHVLLEKMNKGGGLLMFPSAGSKMDLFVAFRYLEDLNSWLILQKNIGTHISSMKRKAIGEAFMISIISLFFIGVIIIFLLSGGWGGILKSLKILMKN